MSMTKKHFTALAEEIAQEYKESTKEEREKAVNTLADFCEKQNPRFDRALFFKAIDKKIREN